MLIRLCWRNIWRNPRRTAVILAAVIIGTWSMVFLGALMRGIAEQMVQHGVATLTGHIQVHRRGYRLDPGVERRMEDPEELEAVLRAVLPQGARWAPRIRVPVVAANARHSAGMTLVGVDPGKEAGVSFIGGALRQGRMLSVGEAHGIVVGKALMEAFGSRLGRKVVVMSQDARGEIASRAFRIVGVYRAEMEATEKAFAFVTLQAAAKMLKTGKDLSEISIVLPRREATSALVKDLRERLDPDVYEIHGWKELLPFVASVLKLYDMFMLLWFLVLFIAMGFGIVNTLLMAVFERTREFGLLKALGMRPGRILRMVLMEAFLLLFLGAVAGNVLGLLTVVPLSQVGIDLSAMARGLEFAGMTRVIYPVLSLEDVLLADVVVLVLGLAVSLYPAGKASRFTPVAAMAAV